MLMASQSIAMEGIEYQSPRKQSKFLSDTNNARTRADFQVKLVLPFRYPAEFDPEQYVTLEQKHEAYKTFTEMMRIYKSIDGICGLECNAPEGSGKKKCWDDLQRQNQPAIARYLFIESQNAVSFLTYFNASLTDIGLRWSR